MKISLFETYDVYFNLMYQSQLPRGLTSYPILTRCRRPEKILAVLIHRSVHSYSRESPLLWVLINDLIDKIIRLWVDTAGLMP